MPEMPNKIIDPELQPHDDDNGVGVSLQPVPVPQQSPGQARREQQVPAKRAPKRLLSTKRKKGFFRKKIGPVPLWTLVLALAVIVLAIAVSIGTRSSPGTTNTTQKPRQATTQPTQATVQPTQPQVTPTSVPTQSQSQTRSPASVHPLSGAMIGGTEQAFTATFGPPISRVTSKTGVTLKYQISDPQVGEIGVFIDTSSSTPFVTGVIVGATQSWNASNAFSICLSFAPKDTQMGNQQELKGSNGVATGMYGIARSDLLKGALPAQYFLDNQNQRIDAGIFGIEFSYVAGSNGSLTDVCSIGLGYRPVQL